MCVQSSQFSKLEKADILELTVKHLRALQRQQAAGVLAQDPSVVSKYRAGFNECAKEVVRYMGSVREVNEDIKDRVLGHLAGCLQVVNQVTPVESIQQQQQQHMKPLHVHIPGSQQPISAGVTTVAPSVIMPNPQTSLHSGVFFTPSPLRSSASPDSQTPSPVSATPLSSLPLQAMPSSVTTAATTVVSHNSAQISGAFKIVPSSACPSGAVAVYLGGSHSIQRSDTVSVDAVPLYSVSLPQHSEGAVNAFVPPPPPPASVSTLSSPSHSHQMMDSRLSASGSPVTAEYPAGILPTAAAASVPVDLRQTRKVKSLVDSEMHQHHQHHQQQHHHHPVSYGQCSPASMADEKLWRPW